MADESAVVDEEGPPKPEEGTSEEPEMPRLAGLPASALISPVGAATELPKPLEVDETLVEDEEGPPKDEEELPKAPPKELCGVPPNATPPPEELANDPPNEDLEPNALEAAVAAPNAPPKVEDGGRLFSPERL